MADSNMTKQWEELDERYAPEKGHGPATPEAR